MTARINELTVFNQGIKAPGGYLTDVKRAEIEQDTSQLYVIPWESFRVHDAIATNLPGTAANDDLGLYGNTFGTGSPSIESGDLKAAGATSRYARFQFALPPEYDDGQTVVLRAHAGMNTTVADTTATLDVECYKSDTEAGIGSDLCATGAQSINSLTFADYDFTITASGLVSGDVLDIRLTMAINDGATGTAVIGEIGWLGFLLDIRG